MDTKHTPEWVVGSHDNDTKRLWVQVNFTGKRVCTITPDENDFDRAKLIASAPDLLAENVALRAILMRYTHAYPAFRMKPIGEEGSIARIEQENLMALEDAAAAALNGGR